MRRTKHRHATLRMTAPNAQESSPVVLLQTRRIAVQRTGTTTVECPKLRQNIDTRSTPSRLNDHQWCELLDLLDGIATYEIAELNPAMCLERCVPDTEYPLRRYTEKGQ